MKKNSRNRLAARGSLFIISAPSGAGKTTLCKKISSIFPNLRLSVSYTTRPRRRGEVNNRDYTFINEEAFRKMIDRGEFVEWAKVHGHFYGTSRKRVEEMMNKGVDVMLDIDVQGARQIREHYRNGVYVFILPPSMRVLGERLDRRMCDSKEEIEKRLKRAVAEIKFYKNYDYVIINDIIERAVDELKSVVQSSKLLIKNINPLWIKRNFFSSAGK